LVGWICVEDKCGKCKGKLKNNLRYEILGKAKKSCVPNLAEIEVRVKLGNCRRRTKEKLSVPVHTIYKEELSDLYAKGCDMVTEFGVHESVRRDIIMNSTNEMQLCRFIYYS
jgi:hypothetical protein